tara:strand:+ start:10965 stop:11162 length:198 start_codon:yes stop_codon:yes gene_type:complete
MKTGYKTTEFWLTLFAVILGAVLAAGLVPTEGPWLQVAGVAETALIAMGYTGARMNLKKTIASSS